MDANKDCCSLCNTRSVALAILTINNDLKIGKDCLVKWQRNKELVEEDIPHTHNPFIQCDLLTVDLLYNYKVLITPILELKGLDTDV